MLPKRNHLWGEGERERLMMRRRFVFEHARDSYDAHEITELWRARCLEDGRPDEVRAQSTIEDDLREGLKELAKATQVDAEVYRRLLIARIEKVFNSERFRTLLENAHIGAINTYLKGQAEIAKLTGAYAPTLNALTDSKGNDILPSLTDAERQARIVAILQTAKRRAEELGETIEGELVPNPEPIVSLGAIGGGDTHDDAEEAESSAS